jgi:quinol monooxygenase YgiN
MSPDAIFSIMVVVKIRRRAFVVTAGAMIGRLAARLAALPQGTPKMYGLIGKMMSVPGRRDELIAILLAGTGAMPGCLSYVVAKDPDDQDGIWITEVWDSEASHTASLKLPSVAEAIAKGRPFIAGFGQRVTTIPIGGQGLERR